MQNPWVSLPDSEPFVAQCDREAILKHNQSAYNKHRIHTQFMPEPFIGNPDAPVFILYRSPAFHSEDTWITDNQDYKRLSRANLRHENCDYPFYHLNPALQGSPGYDWYGGKFKSLIKGAGEETVARYVCVVEFFPYHTERNFYPPLLPSQAYSFYLVKEAMKRRAVIIQAVGNSFWQSKNAIPELAIYPHYYGLENPQNPAISERNCPEGYREIIRGLGG